MDIKTLNAELRELNSKMLDAKHQIDINEKMLKKYLKLYMAYNAQLRDLTKSTQSTLKG